MSCRITAALGSALVLPALLFAQDKRTSDSTDKRFFTGRDALAATLITATSAGISVFDARIARWTQTPSVQGSSARHDAVQALTTMNEVPLTVGAGAAWAIGRLAGWETTADVGLHLSETLLLTLTTSEIVRGTLGRVRPHAAEDDPYDFQYGKGFTQFSARSFPSIHSGVAFAAATALTEEVRHRRPSAVKFAAPVFYTVAMIPGMTRLYLNQHWASDIVAGAAVGTLLGFKVVHYAHTHSPTRLDRALLGLAVIPDQRGGFAAVASFGF